MRCSLAAGDCSSTSLGAVCCTQNRSTNQKLTRSLDHSITRSRKRAYRCTAVQPGVGGVACARPHNTLSSLPQFWAFWGGALWAPVSRVRRRRHAYCHHLSACALSTHTNTHTHTQTVRHHSNSKNKETDAALAPARASVRERGEGAAPLQASADRRSLNHAIATSSSASGGTTSSSASTPACSVKSAVPLPAPLSVSGSAAGSAAPSVV